MATLLLEGDCFVDQFTEAIGRRSASAWRLPRRSRSIEDPAITARGAKFRHMVRVEVHLRDGSVHSETREAPRGSEHSFATREEIVEKFRKLTRAAMPQEQQEALIQAALGIEALATARSSSACCDRRMGSR